MDWARIILEYVKACIWPVTVVVLALVFRAQVRSLIDEVIEISGLGLSVRRRTAEVKDLAEDINAEGPPKSPDLETERPSDASVPYRADLLPYRELAEDDPLGSITGSWRVVRRVIRDVTHSLATDHDLKPGAFTSQHVRSLVPLGLPEDMVGVARELSNVRNDVVHGRRLKTDPRTALNYIEAAEQLLNAVEKLGDPPAVTRR